MVPTEIAARLRRIAGRIEKNIGERNRLVVEAHQAGGSLREIARLAGVSHVTVLNILRDAE